MSERVFLRTIELFMNGRGLDPLRLSPRDEKIVAELLPYPGTRHKK